MIEYLLAPSAASERTAAVALPWPTTRSPWVVAFSIILVHALVSGVLLRRRIRDVLPDADIPRDPFVRKVEIIRRVSERVRATVPESSARIVFCTPRIQGTADFYMNLLPTTLDHGRGLRALCRNIDSVAFVERWNSGYREFALFGGSVDDYVIPFGKGPAALLGFARTLAANGYGNEARDQLAAALQAYPHDPRLRLAYERDLEEGTDTTEVVPGR